MICVCRGDTNIETKKKETFVRDKKKGDKRNRETKKKGHLYRRQKERERRGRGATFECLCIRECECVYIRVDLAMASERP